jgi:DNA-binding CsgD family transcriptional regulator
MVTAERLSRLLLLLYEGASTPGQTRAFLNELVDAIDTKGAALREHVFSTDRNVRIEASSLNETVGYSEESFSFYREYMWQKDLYLQRVLERFRTADCGVSQSLITEAERKRSEYYADFQIPFDVGPMMWQKLAERPDYHASISITRGDGAPFFDKPELEILTALAPHLLQAFRLSRCLSELQTSNAMLTKSIGEMEIAICMARQDGSILRSTEGADRILEARDGIWLNNGRLKAAVNAEQKTLDSLIAGACKTGANGGMDYAIKIQSQAAGNTTIRSSTAQAGGAFLITRRPPLGPLQVVISPFCPGSLMNEPEATPLIQFSDPTSIPKSRAATLRALYRLSPTESRLADLLLHGHEVNEVSDRLKLTLETSRYHLKQVLAKTGTHRQSELIRLMLSLPGQ